MLGWAVAFIVAAVIVVLLGASEPASTFAALTKVLFWIFVAGGLVCLALYYKRSRA
jgi:uncharacterized membrane protein YtjA (UPF0391 family)